MDTSEMRVLLQGAVKIFEARLKSKTWDIHTWDIHRMPQFIMTTHHEGCETCNVYAVHVVKASEAAMVEIPSREIEKAFQIAWPNTVCHIEDEASSESDKKVEWYSDRCEVCLRYFTKSLRATVFMQTVYSTVVRGNSDWVCDKGVNLTNIRKSVTYSV